MTIEIYQIALTTFFGIIATFFGIKYQSEVSKRREIEKQVSEKKYIIYNEILEYFFTIYKDVKFDKKGINQIERSKKLIDIQTKLIIYGNDASLQEFIGWRASSDSNDSYSSLFYFIDLIKEIRKDMGNPETKISDKDILALLTHDYKELYPLKRRWKKEAL